MLLSIGSNLETCIMDIFDELGAGFCLVMEVHVQLADSSSHLVIHTCTYLRLKVYGAPKRVKTKVWYANTHSVHITYASVFTMHQKIPVIASEASLYVHLWAVYA